MALCDRVNPGLREGVLRGLPGGRVFEAKNGSRATAIHQAIVAADVTANRIETTSRASWLPEKAWAKSRNAQRFVIAAGGRWLDR